MKDVSYLEKKAYKIITDALNTALSDKGFKMQEEKTDSESVRRTAFVGADKAFCVEWAAGQNKYRFELGEVEDGTCGEFKEVAVWLFDPSTSNESDAKSIAADFEDTAGEIIKGKTVRVTAAPHKKNKINYEDFCKNAIEIYPQYKDDLDRAFSLGENFDPDAFCRETIGVYMMEMLKEKKNAQLKKLFDFYDKSYVGGDNDVRSIIVVTLFELLLSDKECEALAIQYMSTMLPPVWTQVRKALVKKQAQNK